MIITRKILLPVLVFFGLVIAGLAWIFYSNLNDVVKAQDTVETQRFEQALSTQLGNRGELAAALAFQLANDGQLGEAIRTGDTALLDELGREVFNRLREVYDVSLIQFFEPPARFVTGISARALAAGTEYPVQGIDQAVYRISVTAANAQNRLVSGVELAPDGLNVRGVAPIAGQVGAIEVALPVDRSFISGLKSTYGSDWNILLSRQAIETLNRLSRAVNGENGPVFTIGAAEGPVAELALLATTRLDPIYGESQSYGVASKGNITQSEVKVGDKTYAVTSLPLRDFSGITIGVVDVVSDRTAALAELRGRLTGILGVGLLGLVAGGVSLGLIIRRMLHPVQELTVAATAIAQGELDRALPAATALAEDEIKQLYVSFGSMTRQLRGALSRMEQRVVERTREVERRSLQLRAAAEIGRDITARAQTGSMEGGVRGLLELTVRQIAARFDFYEVSLFLVNEKTGMAELQAASGETGQRLIDQGLQLDLGRPGVISSTIQNNEARIIQDVNDEAEYVREALLVETRSEIAVPLRAAGGGRGEGGVVRPVGALDVQSQQVGAFDENDVAVLQIIADQLANVILNSRLIEELNRTIGELEQASGEFTREAWQRYISGREKGAVTEEPGTVLAQKQIGEAGLRVPLRVRDQTIGEIELQIQGKEATPELVNLAEEAANRLGLVLESTRLLQEARRLAMREQIVGQVAAKVRSSLEMDRVMQVAIREIGEALDLDEVEIRLVGEVKDEAA
jgi:GAF domain-containing protein